MTKSRVIIAPEHEMDTVAFCKILLKPLHYEIRQQISEYFVWTHTPVRELGYQVMDVLSEPANE